MKTAGLDPGSAFWKGVILDGTPRSCTVRAAFSVPAADASVPARDLPDEIGLALGGDLVFLREVHLPALGASQVAEVLPFEVEAFLPRPSEEMALAWIPVRAQEAGQETGSEYLVSAVEKEKLRASLDAWAQRGVDPSTLDVDLFALLPAWEGKVPAGLCLMLDVGHSQTLLSGWKGNELQFARSIRWGTAEREGNSNEAFRTRLLQEVQRTLLTHGWGLGLEALLLSGGGVRDDDLVDFLMTRLKCAATVWEGPELGGEPLGPEYAVAYGMALKAMGGSASPVEFRAGAFVRPRGLEKAGAPLAVLLGCLCILFGAWSWTGWKETRRLQAEHRKIADWEKDVWLKYFPQLPAPADVRSAFRDRLDAWIKGETVATGGRLSALEIWSEIVSYFPEKMPLRIKSVAIQDRQILVDAQTDEGGPEGGWVGQLEKQAREGGKLLAVTQPLNPRPDKGSLSFQLALGVRKEETGNGGH